MANSSNPRPQGQGVTIRFGLRTRVRFRVPPVRGHMKALLCSTGKRNGGLSRPTPAHTRQKSAKESGRILDRPCGVAPAPPIPKPQPFPVGVFHSWGCVPARAPANSQGLCKVATSPPRAGIRSLRPDHLWLSHRSKEAKSVTGECHSLYNQKLIEGLGDSFDWKTGWAWETLTDRMAQHTLHI